MVEAVTAPPRTLQERLRECSAHVLKSLPPDWQPEPGDDTTTIWDEAAAALDAQSQLLAEAREALELIILAYVQHSGETPIVAKAHAVLAKLKAASGEG